MVLPTNIREGRKWNLNKKFVTTGQADIFRVRSRYYSLAGHYKGLCLQSQKLDLAVKICKDKFLERVPLKIPSNNTEYLSIDLVPML